MAGLDALGYVHCASTEVVERWTDRVRKGCRPLSPRHDAGNRAHAKPRVLALGCEDGRAAGRSSGVPLFGTTKLTSTIRFLVLVIFLVLLAAFLVANAGPTSAAPAYTVAVSPSASTFAAGGDGVFIVRLEGGLSVFPSFDYEVEGGTLTGVVALNPTGPTTAEGSVHVTRSTPGTARLNVSLGGRALGSAEATFAPVGQVQVRVQLDAGIDAAARTWRFEVVNTSDQVVATLSAGTSGDAPVATVSSGALPYGFYTVRQVLGSDTGTACTGGAFYEVVAPVSAATTVELAAANAVVPFEIRPCAALPADQRVDIPIDTVAPGGFGPGVIGDPDVLPGVTPINDVRGARQAGDVPLPPRTGNTRAGGPSGSSPEMAVLLGLVSLSMFSALLWPVAVAVRGSKR